MSSRLLEAGLDLMDDAGTFVWSCLTAWQAYLTGGAIQAGISLWERSQGKNISWSTYRWGVWSFLIASFFVVWRKERRRGDGALAHGGLQAVQKAAIANVLRKYPRPVDCEEDAQYRYFIIFPIPGDPRAARVAADLREAFVRGGHDPVLTSNELPGLRDYSPYKHGIWVRGDDGTDALADYEPPTLSVVKEVLSGALIQFTQSVSPVSDVELIVGSPPETPSDDAVLARSAARFEDAVADRDREITDLRQKVSDLEHIGARLLAEQERTRKIAEAYGPELKAVIDKQEARTSALERDTRELQPRRLTEKDRITILAPLAAATKYSTDSGKTLRVVVVKTNCADCAVYAGDYEAIFVEAGFVLTDQSVTAFAPSYELDPGQADDVRRGISIRYDPRYFEKFIQEARYVDALIAGLTQAGIEFRVFERDYSSFTFIVGER